MIEHRVHDGWSKWIEDSDATAGKKCLKRVKLYDIHKETVDKAPPCTPVTFPKPEVERMCF